MSGPLYPCAACKRTTNPNCKRCPKWRRWFSYQWQKIRTDAMETRREGYKLKPCPFCGCELELRHYSLHSQYEHPENDCVLANADSEYVPLWIDCEDKKGIEAWNRRADNG